jgi:hypothetical protein
MEIKQVVSVVAVALTFVAYIPYYRDIIVGKIHPHIYTWSIWGLITSLLVILQVRGGAGSAVWVTASAGLLCIGVAVLSIKNGKKNITVTDTIVAILALIAIVFWLVVKQPELATIMVITADMLGFMPTIRKTWHKPHSESIALYSTNAFRFILAFIAIESYTFLSTAWIVAWIIGNGGFAIMLLIRRKQIKPPESSSRIKSKK